MIRVGRRQALLALCAGLLLPLAAAAPADAGQVNPRADEEMMLRAINGEEPTPEDQRRAQQLLREWRLSEQAHPSNDLKTEPMFRAMAEGQKLSPELVERAREMYRDHFTPEGRAAHRARAAAGAGGSSASPKAGSPYAPKPEAKATDWLMPGMAGLLLVCGVIVSALAGRRRSSDSGL